MIDVLRLVNQLHNSLGEASGHSSTPVKNSMCASFEEYKEVPKTITLDFMKYGITWVV